MRGCGGAGGQVPPHRAAAALQDVVAEHEDEDRAGGHRHRPHLCHLPHRVLLGGQLLQVTGHPACKRRCHGLTETWQIARWPGRVMLGQPG